MNLSIRDRAVVRPFRSGGPGGQHRNKRCSAVRAVDPVTGLSAVASESRSQAENRERALRRLEEKVARLFRRPPRRIPVKKSRSVRLREREEKRRHSQKKAGRQAVRWDE